MIPSNNALATSRWWRSECQIEQGHDRSSSKIFKNPPISVVAPQEPFHEYDPFQFYFPPGSTAKGMRSLPYLFAEINPDNPEELVEFCTRFGMPGPFRDFEEWDSWSYQTHHPNLPAVRQRLDQAPKGGNEYYAIQQEFLQVARAIDPSVISRMSLHSLSREVYLFKNLLTLAEHRHAPDQTTGWITEQDKPHLLRGWFRPIPTNSAEATTLLEEMLARGCMQLRVRFFYDQQHLAWRMTWESLSLTSLMYLMVAMDLQGPGRILTCPSCKRSFLAHRTDKTYCSPACQNRFHSLQYYRAKSSKQLKKPRQSSKRQPKKGG